MLTWQQIPVWHDTESLWRHATEVLPDCTACHINVGYALLERGAPGAALDHFRRAVALSPDRVGAYRGLGFALMTLGRVPEAIEIYAGGIRRRPDAVAVRASLAAALAQVGRGEEAVARLGEADRFTPPADLVSYFRAAVAASPTAPIPRLGLAQAYLALGEPERAREQYERLRALDPRLSRFVAGAFTSAR
jgi:Flp pilus assembly protein TadD